MALRPGLVENVDYEFILPAEWALICKWYDPVSPEGPGSGGGGGGGGMGESCGPAVCRRGVLEAPVSYYSTAKRAAVVELYGINIKVPFSFLVGVLVVGRRLAHKILATADGSRVFILTHAGRPDRYFSMRACACAACVACAGDAER